ELPLRADRFRHRLRGTPRQDLRAHLPPRGRGGGRARDRRTPRCGRSGRLRRARRLAGRAAPGGRRASGHARDPGRQVRRRGRGAPPHRPARARRGDRQGRRALGAAADLPPVAGLHRRAGPPVPGHPALRRAGRARRERAHRHRPPSTGCPRRADRPHDRRQDADRPVRAAPPARRL
ncbi:MAG: ADP-ribose pyrophosphatase, partial [uncultured Solirubrobacteraceae bacterium]